MVEGIKHDEKKLPMASMLCSFSKPLQEVCEVYNYGANLYGLNNYKSVDVHRYHNALQRHMFAYYAGETHDKESGLKHLAHVAWNALAILELTGDKND